MHTRYIGAIAMEQRARVMGKTCKENEIALMCIVSTLKR